MDAQASLRLCCYKSQETVFSVAVNYHERHHERLESKMRNLISVKYDTTQTELLFAQFLQSICSVYVDTPSYPAGDRFFYHTSDKRISK